VATTPSVYTSKMYLVNLFFSEIHPTSHYSLNTAKVGVNHQSIIEIYPALGAKWQTLITMIAFSDIYKCKILVHFLKI